MARHIEIWPSDKLHDLSEQWRIIPGFAEYEASNWGRIRRVGGERALRARIDPDGRCRVNLWRANAYKSRRVHQLVALAFHGPRPAGKEVAHLDGNTANNRSSNLAWCTPKENNGHKRLHGTQPQGEHIWCAKMSDAQVGFLKATYGGRPGEITRFARSFGVSRWAVRNALFGRAWKHINTQLQR